MVELIRAPVDELLQTVLKDAVAPVLVVDPSPTVIEALVECASERDTPLTIRLVTTERTLKDAVSDFRIASLIADLVNDDILTLRSVDKSFDNQLTVTEARLAALVAAGDELGGLVTDDSAFVRTAFDHYRGYPDF